MGRPMPAIPVAVGEHTRLAQEVPQGATWLLLTPTVLGRAGLTAGDRVEVVTVADRIVIRRAA